MNKALNAYVLLLVQDVERVKAIFRKIKRQRRWRRELRLRTEERREANHQQWLKARWTADNLKRQMVQFGHARRRQQTQEFSVFSSGIDSELDTPESPIKCEQGPSTETLCYCGKPRHLFR